MRSRLLRITERNETHVQANRSLCREFTGWVAHYEWDVALLQEAPPLWFRAFRRRTGSVGARAFTSRNVVPPLQQEIALVEIQPLDTDVAASLRQCGDDDHAAGPRRVLLNYDGIAAGRHFAAGKNANRFAGFDRAGKGAAGGDFSDDAQIRRHILHIRHPHRIPVHRRDVGGRLATQRPQVLPRSRTIPTSARLATTSSRLLMI